MVGNSRPEPSGFPYESIGYTHQKTHEGKAFVASVDIGTVASNGGTANITFTTTGDETIHLRAYEFIATTGPGKVVIYEGADITGGTTINPQNLRRTGSVDDPDMDIFEGGTVNSTGTQLETSRVTGDNKTGDTVQNTAAEWVLAEGETYLMQYTNEASNDAQATFDMLWYEERI